MVSSNLIRSSIKMVKLFQLANKTTQVMAVRSCGWVRDYKPGPFPRTKEEREAAARKYNLIPEDYEPYEEGSGYGDYPKLPVVSQDAQDPYYDFDYYGRRTNYGETLHVDYDILISEKTNPNEVYRYPFSVMAAALIVPFLFFTMLAWIDRHFDLHTANPMKPKQYPGDGKKHYTFESLD